jgi:hypothetical protein
VQAEGEDGGDVFVQLCILELQGENGDADDGDDRLQPLQVLAHEEGQVVILW